MIAQQNGITTNVSSIGSPSTNVTVSMTNENNPVITQTVTITNTASNTNNDQDTVTQSNTVSVTNSNSG